jgi:hypothetical protein
VIAGLKMKRLILFLWVLLLLLYAAGDGFIGSYKSAAPEYLLASAAVKHRCDIQTDKSEFGRRFSKSESGRRILTVPLQVTRSLQLSRQFSCQSVTAAVPHSSKITFCRHLSSSGGLPL